MYRRLFFTPGVPLFTERSPLIVQGDSIHSLAQGWVPESPGFEIYIFYQKDLLRITLGVTEI